MKTEETWGQQIAKAKNRFRLIHSKIPRKILVMADMQIQRDASWYACKYAYRHVLYIYIFRNAGLKVFLMRFMKKEHKHIYVNVNYEGSHTTLNCI